MQTRRLSKRLYENIKIKDEDDDDNSVGSTHVHISSSSSPHMALKDPKIVSRELSIIEAASNYKSPKVDSISEEIEIKPIKKYETLYISLNIVAALLHLVFGLEIFIFSNQALMKYFGNETDGVGRTFAQLFVIGIVAKSFVTFHLIHNVKISPYQLLQINAMFQISIPFFLGWKYYDGVILDEFALILNTALLGAQLIALFL